MPYFSKIYHSLSARLVLLFVAIALVFIILVGGAMGMAFKANFEGHIRPHLVRYLEYIQADVGSPPELARARAITDTLSVNVYYFGPDDNWASTSIPLDLDTVRPHKRFIEKGIEYTLGNNDNYEILISRHPDYTLAFSVKHAGNHFHWHSVMPITILLLILLTLYLATKRLFAPIATIKAGIAKIGQGELDHRIEVKRRDELGDLADTINGMAGDIQQMLEAKRQLLLAISHELRSPLTRAKVAVELMKDQAQRDEINHDLNEMEGLIEELLETERLSVRHNILNKSQQSLNKLITELREEYFPYQPITTKIPEHDIIVSIDRARIKLLLKNLLNNALAHTPAGSDSPKIILSKQDATIIIKVVDHGTGIAKEHIPHLTEPFYRADPARQRKTGGYGLGLYLCQVITEAHDGQLNIDSHIGQGTTVTVSLPASGNPA